uniref:Capsid protein n=1 Tax=Red panda feces-associated gemycircularvirus TaxID=2864013 RepID=A0A8K1M4X6_9VIRU|nr:capsid protein [Red panda feces-associated gemycircularvirus]
MPIRRYSPRYRRKATRRYAKRPTSRRYSSRRPTRYGKKRYGGKRVSNKRILDLTSIKKRDTMLPAFWTGSASQPQPGGYTVSGTGGGNGGAVTMLMWCATARDNTIGSGAGAGNRFTPATRTATTCYMVGLAENVEISTNSGTPWQWRRICFTFKDPTSISATQPYYLEVPSGYQRLAYNVSGSSAADNANLSALRDLIFKGQLLVDWSSYLTAPTDNQRVTIKYDTTTIISSGNQSGKLVNKKLWMPMKSNLVYDDDESGGSETSKYFSVGGKAGMGDYYVLDIFQAGTGATSSDQLYFQPQATLYWHEK